MLDDLTQVSCEVLVTKTLPNCEHEVEMACSKDPGGHKCRARCNGILSCCGRNCQASCYECPQRRVPEPGSIPVHQSHPCSKRLYCEHQCDRVCSADHECTTECKAPCRQACAHARCNKPCSVPCAPCQEPCIWFVHLTQIIIYCSLLMFMR
jgi:hypothetical protein